MSRRVRWEVSFCLFAVLVPFGLAHAAMSVSGQFAVGESGAATYMVPIQVAPGTAGIEPKLSISYNSQAGNGLLGLGWSLSGLSSVDRCPQTVTQDGAIRGINYDANDRYCLDGQRLIVVSGAYGANGAEYRTERESFAKIVSYGVAGSGPASFKVWTKSGQTMEYGNSADSRIEAQGKTTVRTWALNRLQDAKNNYFTVTYNKEPINGDYYPKQIDYTGNVTTGSAPNNSVQFQYEARSDIAPLYQAGSVIKNGVRLFKIQTFAAGSLTKEYRLSYETEVATQRPRLISLAECDAGGACLPPATVVYSSNSIPTFGSTLQSAVLDWGKDAGRAWVDINGDGKTDYCRVSGGPGTYTLACTLATSTGFGQTITSGIIDPGYDVGREWADITGDGKPDYCRVVGASGAYQLACTLQTDTGFGQTIMSGTIDPGYDIGRGWGDVNGDGRADFCRVVGQSGAYQLACTLSTGAGFGQTVTSGVIDRGYDIGQAWVDFDGDGRVDFCRLVGNTNLQSSYLACTLSIGTGFGATIISGVVDWGYESGRTWIDVNGDGKPDYCRLAGNTNLQSSYVACTLSTGTGFGETIVSGVIDWGYELGRAWVDVNGDGKADYCRVVGNAAPYQVACTLSTGTGFGETIMSAALDRGYDAGRTWADANGDGVPDFCRRVGNVNLQSSYVACTLGVADTRGAVKITTGLGMQTTIAYKPLTDAIVYTKGSGATYPIVDMQIPMYAVSSVALSNGIGGTLTTNYTYGGLKADLTGRGLLGFSWMQAIKAETSLGTRTEYRQDWPYVGLPSLIKTTIASGGNGGSLSQVTNTYGCKDFVSASGCTVALGRRYFPFTSQSVESGWDLNGAALPVVTTASQYDAWGNATQITVSASDGYSKTTTNTYTNDTVNWFLGRLTGATVTSTTP